MAPEELRLVQEFVNTKNLMRGYDLLESVESAVGWFAESGYEVSGRNISREDLERLHSLREGLREIFLSHNIEVSAGIGEAISRLNRLVGFAALVARFNPSGEPFLEPSSTGIERFTEDILAAAVRAQHLGLWQRLKACANEECRWVFYDGSKNRSGSWCVMEICGSRAKMRSYRKRKAAVSRRNPS